MCTYNNMLYVSVSTYFSSDFSPSVRLFKEVGVCQESCLEGDLSVVQKDETVMEGGQ